MRAAVNKVSFWYVLLFFIVFGPLLFLLGFGVSDDLSFVGNIAPSFWNDLSYSLSRSGHISRPIYGLVQTASLHVFREHYIMYNVLRFIFWILIIYQSRKVFSSFFAGSTVWIFVFFLSFPIFSSAHLFNFFQMGYLLSLLFYLMALKSLKDVDGGFTRENYTGYLIFSLLALFSCEIIFPLLVFPLLYNHWGGLKKLLNSRLLRWSLLIFLLFFMHKFLIGPIYQNDTLIYGFSPSKHSILQSLYYFVVILIEIPLLLLEVLPFFFSEPLLWTSILVIPFIYLIRINNDFVYNKRFFSAMLLTLGSCSLIFLMSNYPAVSFGLYNKMMLPSHLCYAVLVAILCLRLLKTKVYYFAYLLAILWFASMQMQALNAIRSCEIREIKLKEYSKIVHDSKSNSEFVLIEAPYFLESNYNNEHVFALNDDFHGGLSLYGYEGNTKLIYPFCGEMLDDRSYLSNHNIQGVIHEFGLNQFKVIHNGSLSKNNYSLNSLKELSFKRNKDCLRSRMRTFIIHKINGK